MRLLCQLPGSYLVDALRACAPMLERSVVDVLSLNELSSELFMTVLLKAARNST